MAMKILMVGDIVGAPGRMAFARLVTRMRQEGRVDFVVANAENAAGGRGLTAALGEELLNAGADVLTLGDHAWDQKDVAAYLERESRVVRPANFAPGCPGRGWTTVSGPQAEKITVVNLVGRVFMNPYDCPFRAVEAILSRDSLGRIILVDMHAEATSEKVALGRYLDGRVTCVVGTHTHVQTSDETVLPKGTGYITDLGMTGPKDSVLGRDLKSVTEMLLTGMPAKFEVARGNPTLEGVIIEVDSLTGRCAAIRRVREKAE